MIRGWGVVIGVFFLAWAWTLQANLGAGVDGTLYPVTSYPMFSGEAPNGTTRYFVEADGDASLRIPLAQAFDEDRSVRGQLVPRVASYLVRSGGGCPPGQSACDLDLPEALLSQWSASVQARLGMAEPPGALHLVKERRDFAGTLLQETRYALA